jgi:hypothetical protein
MPDEEDVVHLVNNEMDWHLTETATGELTDGRVSEDLQRDRVHQIVQWLRHFPERLPKMEALTVDGRRALEQARAKDRRDSGRRW